MRRDNETLTIGRETPIGFAWPAAAASHGSDYPKGNISRLYGSRHATIILSDGAARISMVSPRKTCRRRVITIWLKKTKDYMGSPSFVLIFSPYGNVRSRRRTFLGKVFVQHLYKRYCGKMILLRNLLQRPSWEIPYRKPAQRSHL